MMERTACRILINGIDAVQATDDSTPTITLQRRGDMPHDKWKVSISDASGEIWQSGALLASMAHIRYAGPPLLPKSEYSVYAEMLFGDRTVASARTTLETGFMGTPWLARWIEPQQEQAVREKELAFHEHFLPNSDFSDGHTRLKPCQQVRKAFVLPGQIARARLYATAHGVYELCVNGSLPDGSLLAPETSTYEKRLYYRAYDVTALLHEGENAVAATLADGWWIGRIGISGDSCQYGDRLGFLMQLEVELTNGERCVIASDESFLCRRSNTDYADLFIGERRDFSRSEEDEVWSPGCKGFDAPYANLIAQPTAPICVLETLEPCFFRTPKGELMADFGQCVSGVAQIAVHAPRGTEVTLEFTETLDEQGNFHRNIIGRNKDQRDVFVCGDGETRFCPRFTYHGFRYVRICGVSREQISRLQAQVIGTPVRPRGKFACSDERLNRFQACIERSVRSNMISVPTDCPQREKVGWTGDVLPFAPTGCFDYDLSGFLDAWLANMRAEQAADGGVPVAVPNYPLQEKMQRGMSGDNTSSAWSDACVHVPWALYQSYGDTRVLADNLPMMRRWLNFVARRCREIPENIASLPEPHHMWNDYLWTKGFHFGDWFVPSIVREEGGVMRVSALTRDVIGSSFYALTLRVFFDVLSALSAGNPRDEALIAEKERVTGLLGQVQSAVRACFVSSEGRIEPDLQGLYVLVLHAGIVEGTLRQKVAARLVTLIDANGGTLDTGFVTTPYLLDVLWDNGCRDVALRLLFQTKSPSWLYMVEHGATSVWENWEAIRPDGSVTTSSMNHYSLGCVGDWIYRKIGGLQSGAPGYGHIVFAPDIRCGLEYAECSVETAYGTASCAWRWVDGGCRIELCVPYGAIGEFEGAQLVPGVHTFMRESAC